MSAPPKTPELIRVSVPPHVRLMDEVRELLQRIGPTDPDDVRDRLCVASHKRFQAAISALIRTGQVRRCGSKNLREAGDTRPRPASSIEDVQRRKRAAA